MRTLINERDKRPIIRILRDLQFVLLFFGVATLVFWLLLIFKVNINQNIIDVFDWITKVGAFFFDKTIKVGLYYVNLAYLSSVVLFLVSAYFLNFVVDFLNSLDEKKEIKVQKEKKLELIKVNAEMQDELVREELKNKSFMALIGFKVQDERRTAWDDEVIEPITSKNVVSNFFELLEGNLDCKSEFVDDDLLLIFDNFSEVDLKLNIILSLFKTLCNEYSQKKCKISWGVALDVFKNMTEIGSKSIHLKKMLDLMIPNKFMCYSTFKNRYELHSNKKYDVKSNGFYVLNGNEEIFTIEKKEIKKL